MITCAIFYSACICDGNLRVKRFAGFSLSPRFTIVLRLVILGRKSKCFIPGVTFSQDTRISNVQCNGFSPHGLVSGWKFHVIHSKIFIRSAYTIGRWATLHRLWISFDRWKSFLFRPLPVFVCSCPFSGSGNFLGLTAEILVFHLPGEPLGAPSSADPYHEIQTEFRPNYVYLLPVCVQILYHRDHNKIEDSAKGKKIIYTENITNADWTV